MGMADLKPQGMMGFACIPGGQLDQIGAYLGAVSLQRKWSPWISRLFMSFLSIIDN